MYLERPKIADICEETIGAQIVSRKDELGMTVGNMASYSGLSESTIYDLINGVTQNPGIRTLHKIAYALQCEVPDLVPSLYGEVSGDILNGRGSPENKILTRFQNIGYEYAESLSDMARQLEVSRSSIQDILNGQMPTLYMVQRLCDTYGLTYFDVIPLSASVYW